MDFTAKADMMISHARRCGAVRQEERERMAGLIEVAIYEAKDDTKTVDALVHLARAILDPR